MPFFVHAGQWPELVRLLLTATSRWTRLLSLLVLVLSVAPWGFFHAVYTNRCSPTMTTMPGCLGHDGDHHLPGESSTPHPFWSVYLGLPGARPPSSPNSGDDHQPPLLSWLSEYFVSLQAAVAPSLPTAIDDAQAVSSLIDQATNATIEELWAMLTSSTGGLWAHHKEHPLWIQYQRAVDPENNSAWTEQQWKVVVPWCLFFLAAVVLPCNLLVWQAIRAQWVRWKRQHRRQRNYDKAVVILQQHCSHRLTESDFVEKQEHSSSNDAATCQAAAPGTASTAPLTRLWHAFFPEAAAETATAHRHKSRKRGPPVAVVPCRLPITLSLLSSPVSITATPTTSTRFTTLDECCAICLHNYECRDTVVWSPNPQCTHLFHRNCLLRWLKHNPRFPCPVCRRQYVIAIPPPTLAKAAAAAR